MKVKGFCRKPRPENPLGNTEYSLKAYFYLLPAALILAVFVFFPIIMTLRMGFYESYVYLTDVGKGFGLASFRYVLKDPAFRSAVRNTLIITFIGVPITIILSLGSALFINSLGKGKGLFQTIYFLPYVPPPLPSAWCSGGCSTQTMATSTCFKLFWPPASEMAYRSQSDYHFRHDLYDLERNGL